MAYRHKPIFIKSFTPNLTVEEIQKLDRNRGQYPDDDPLDTYPVSDNPKPKKPWTASTPVNKGIYILEKACKACNEGCPDHEHGQCPPDCSWHKCDKSISKSSVMPSRPLTQQYKKGWKGGKEEWLDDNKDNVDDEGINYDYGPVTGKSMRDSINKLNNMTKAAIDAGTFATKKPFENETDKMETKSNEDEKNDDFMDYVSKTAPLNGDDEDSPAEKLKKMAGTMPATPPTTSAASSPSVSKALNSRSLSIPRPVGPYDPFRINRSATTPITRRYSGIVGDNGVAPLVGETMEEAALKEQRLLDEAQKSCPVHGITYKASSACHPCEVQKAQTCDNCGNQLYKSLQGYICTHCNRV